MTSGSPSQILLSTSLPLVGLRAFLFSSKFYYGCPQPWLSDGRRPVNRHATTIRYGGGDRLTSRQAIHHYRNTAFASDIVPAGLLVLSPMSFREEGRRGTRLRAFILQRVSVMSDSVFAGRYRRYLGLLAMLSVVLAADPMPRMAFAEPAGREVGEKKLEAQGGKATTRSDAATASKDANKEAGEDTAAKKAENVLVWLYRSMGLRYVVIFLTVTFNEIALVVMILLELRRRRICPMDLASEFEDRLNKRQYQEAYDLVKDDRSFLGRVLAAGMANLSDGHQAATEAMQEAGEEQNMRLEQRNGYIALIAQLGPLLGLLATVDGIVRAFSVIAGKDVTPKPSELAQGISIALVNTVVGLWLAIPSIVFYNIVRNRLARLVHEVGIVSTRLMKRFANVTPAKKA